MNRKADVLSNSNGRMYPLPPPLLEYIGPFVQVAITTDLEDDVKPGHNIIDLEANLEVFAVLFSHAPVLQ